MAVTNKDGVMAENGWNFIHGKWYHLLENFKTNGKNQRFLVLLGQRWDHAMKANY